ncbi:MAG: hypothetical protein HY831_03530 [Candidatus Aenigmarchaeota archaeon]|nr:hypothetical protein [Candidatus Aenigmarchaeota archaeon]
MAESRDPTLPKPVFFRTDKVEELSGNTEYSRLLRDYYYDGGRLIPRSWVNGCPPVYESK